MSTSAKPEASSKSVLDADLVDHLREQVIYDSGGKQHKFEELISAKEGEKCLVIFIRHFHCGMCQSYLQELTKAAPPQHFEWASVRVSVIGHGEASIIKSYAETLDLPWDIYSQPDKGLHKALGMTQSLSMGPKPEHQKQSAWSNVTSSITNAFKVGGVLSGGQINQNGGELIFGADFVCTYKHMMQNTRDHTPVPQLLSKLGVKQA